MAKEEKRENENNNLKKQRKQQQSTKYKTQITSEDCFDYFYQQITGQRSSSEWFFLTKLHFYNFDNMTEKISGHNKIWIQSTQ